MSVAVREAVPTLLVRGERQLVVGGALGRGSQSTVHIARLEQTLGHEVLGRPVALKVFQPMDPEDVFRAVRKTALVRHPNVVQVTDAFIVGESPYVVLELIEGMSLAAFLTRWQDVRRRLPLEQALFIACEAAEGLAGARLANLTHHDLSARQVLLSWHGEVKVGDFGRRGSGDVASGIRRKETDIRARVSHLSPEVARGAHGDSRSDVFSLGVMLHEMLHGPRFAHGCATQDVVEMTRDGVVPRPVLAPVVPRGVEEILERALEIDPRARQAHAGVVAYDLRREALALGIGDARVFLRNALFEMSEGIGVTSPDGSGHDARS
jgi:eukaryotic-like serine/threonine-protein kinase